MSGTKSIKELEAQIDATQRETKEILTDLLASFRSNPTHPQSEPDSHVKVSTLKSLAMSLGFKPSEVIEIILRPSEVRVTCIDKSEYPPRFSTRIIPVVP